MRRTRVQHNPKSLLSSASRRSDGYVWKAARKYPGRAGACLPWGGLSRQQCVPIAHRKSAEGIVGGSQVRLVRHSKAQQAEQQIGQAATTPTEGRNGERPRMGR